MFSGKQVLVTGGCGSIGSAVVERILDHHSPAEVTVFDNNEHRVGSLKQNLDKFGSELKLVLGDVREREHLEHESHAADIVIHTAGLKHVPNCEMYPRQAARTNITGTSNVIRAALSAGVESVLTLSTDKAAAPASVMGASKMIAERMTLIAGHRYESTQFNCVRLGNVLGSSNSVVPIFCNQIENGGAVTVTHPEMTRFVMTKTETIEFILESLATQSTGRIHIPKPRSLRVIDLAEVLVDRYPENNESESNIEISVIGRRPGEKIHEQLFTPDETYLVTEHSDRFVLKSPLVAEQKTCQNPQSNPDLRAYSSDKATFLDQDQIHDLLQKTTAFSG